MTCISLQVRGRNAAAATPANVHGVESRSTLRWIQGVPGPLRLETHVSKTALKAKKHTCISLGCSFFQVYA